MTYALALQTPESPLTEDWVWTTDLHLSYDGSEDRIPLARYPKRAFSGQYEFDRVEDVRRHLAMMQQRFRTTFRFPLYQYLVKLKAPAIAGAAGVAVNATRSDLREGKGALLVEGDTYEELTVDAVVEDGVTFTTPLVNSYSARAILCPVTECYATTGQQFNRRNPDGSGQAGFRYNERAPWTPHVSPLNDVSLTMYDGKAVLDKNAVGSAFEMALDSGIFITDYTGLVDIMAPWTQAQWAFPLRWQVNRVLDNDSWLWWQVFADHVQGSSVPFFLPSFRSDLPVVTPAAGSGSQVTIEGDLYSQHYWPLDTFEHIVIDSDAGRHYAKVTAVVAIAGNDRLTFTPALPAGATWDDNQKVGFMLPVRIADDKITCTHYGMQTEVSMALRTVEGGIE